MKMKPIMQPLLLALYPTVFLYSRNFGEAPFWDFFAILLVILTTVFVSFGCFKLIFKDASKASWFTSIFVIIWFYLGSVIDFLYELGFRVFRWRYLMILSLLILIFIFIKLKRSKKTYVFVSTFLIIPLLALNLFSMSNALYGLYKIHILINNYDEKNQVFLDKYYNVKRPENLSNFPSVYFIILDRYPSRKTLLRNFGYDNLDFLKSLKEKDFFIPERSYSNYHSTGYSIPTTLNLNYLDMQGFPGDDVYAGLIDHMLMNNNVALFFANMGYGYINVPSYWHFAEETPYSALKNDFYFWGFKSFYNRVWITSSIVVRFFKSIYIGPFWERWVLEPAQRRAIRKQLAILKDSAHKTGPNYSFSHFHCPHPPALFDSHGGFVSLGYSSETYIEQIKFINKEIFNVISYILANSKQKPIIILQSDHGIVTENNDDLFGILSAYYIPDRIIRDKLYHTISPINNFRFIFDHYFHSNFGLLRDSLFVPLHEYSLVSPVRAPKKENEKAFVNIDRIITKRSNVF